MFNFLLDSGPESKFSSQQEFSVTYLCTNTKHNLIYVHTFHHHHPSSSIITHHHPSSSIIIHPIYNPSQKKLTTKKTPPPKQNCPKSCFFRRFFRLTDRGEELATCCAVYLENPDGAASVDSTKGDGTKGGTARCFLFFFSKDVKLRKHKGGIRVAQLVCLNGS